MSEPATQALFSAAKEHHRAGRLADAERLYREVLALDPAHHDCLHRLGVLAHQCGDSESAARLIAGAIALDDGVATYHNHLGAVQQAVGRLDQAFACFMRALALAPDLAEAHNNLGNLHLARDDPDQAITSFERAQALAPEVGDIPFNLGNALRAAERPEAAEAAYRRAIALRPDHAEAHVNLAFVLLARGRFAEGDAEFDWRWRLQPPPSPIRSFAAPEWRGEPLAGPLLLHAEQGLGDTIQFCRFAKQAARLCHRVILEVPPSLKRLLAPLGAVASGERLPSFNAHCPLMSLPWRLGVAPLSWTTPYLSAEPARIAAWRDRLPPGYRIGIAWQGNPAVRVDRHRSIPLAQFAPLAEIPGVHLISLQRGHGLEQLGAVPNLTVFDDLDAGPDAFIDTAAIMTHLDLVVTSDCAVAHLAGALGRPVWLALEKTPDWRWQMSSDASPWYPTMRLFRQEKARDWRGPFARMTEELSRRGCHED